jgi:hypothetical protein
MTSHTIRRVVRLALCSAVVASLMGSSAAALAGTVVSSFKGQGVFASADGQLDGCVWFWLSVNRGGAASAPETYLQYGTYDSCTGESSYGYGRIPNNQFVVSGKRSKLKVNPTASPEMYTEGRTGLIELTWTADQSVRWTWDGRSESITPTQRTRSRGKSDSSAASVVGTMLSLALNTKSASVGKNRDMFIEVVR